MVRSDLTFDNVFKNVTLIINFFLKSHVPVIRAKINKKRL